MKGILVSKFRNCLWMLVLTTIVVAIVACEQQVREKQEQPVLLEEKPLLLEEPPLLLEEKEATGPVADNSRCHVCHINYSEEALAVTHARANVGCEQCHGSSDAHCGDEDNITPPDIMYPPEKINDFCKSCHPKARLGEGKKFCTDCHGEHRLGYRTRKWDKTTGKLREDDKVRMTEKPNE
jgi:hypothetical protein